jgi:hypothetical protein
MAKNNFKYGPDNPHPLSTRKTELIWEGKYDEYGNRREVDIAGCAMPMRKIETIDEPASRLKPLGLFDLEKALTTMRRIRKLGRKLSFLINQELYPKVNNHFLKI